MTNKALKVCDLMSWDTLQISNLGKKKYNLKRLDYSIDKYEINLYCSPA